MPEPKIESSRPTEVDLNHPTIPRPPKTPTESGEALKIKPDALMDELLAERRQELFDAINALKFPSGDPEERRWEQREALIKLINFVAESEYPDNPVEQAERTNQLMERVPADKPTDDKSIRTIINLAQRHLEFPEVARGKPHDTEVDGVS